MINVYQLFGFGKGQKVKFYGKGVCCGKIIDLQSFYNNVMVKWLFQDIVF